MPLVLLPVGERAISLQGHSAHIVTQFVLQIGLLGHIAAHMSIMMSRHFRRVNEFPRQIYFYSGY